MRSIVMECKGYPLTHPHTGRPPQPLDPHTRSAKTKTESGPPKAVIQSRFGKTKLRGIFQPHGHYKQMEHSFESSFRQVALYPLTRGPNSVSHETRRSAHNTI